MATAVAGNDGDEINCSWDGSVQTGDCSDTYTISIFAFSYFVGLNASATGVFSYFDS